MIEAWQPEDVYAAEAAVSDTLGEGDLMARAVAGLARVAQTRLHERGGRRVVALVGPGNNGADALYAVARLGELGFEAAAVHGPAPLHRGAEVAARAAEVRLVDGTAQRAVTRTLAGADVVLDGVLGMGGRPGLPEFARPWVDAVPDTAYVIAVDLPSGQDPRGEVLDPDGVFADETVTFSVAKPVHLLPATQEAVGLLTVVDIGVAVETDPAVVRITPDDVADLWPVPGPLDDKYSRGVLGVVAGGEDYTGAPILACTAAVSAGVGMVRYVGTPTPEQLVRTLVPEVVLGPGRVQAWVVGPGLDVTSRKAGAKAQVDVAKEALSSDLPVLVDAGGLDLVHGRRSAPTLLTPHAGECARLLTRLARRKRAITPDEVKAAPLHHARRLAALTGASVLLKGSTTLVVSPDPDAPVHSQRDAPPWLATAGAGDVLAGLVGALLASGLEPTAAGALGALVHGVAADAANPAGPVRARAVAEAIPATVARLLAR
ncbi:conserved hypothetical protein [Nostocoides japonicum T1-X7]|uniref:ADP-dependent (S)-NAD(P)H-hydrate dehydratase n=1 Tax=Nostocoides japonicum T1-X7 TaxID=1194083 RepID=A0A077M7D5_9MICO|nr:bifunctional ADP-dependent NAD(P)H-hydrate dehydratase/NAD(P)H-hydrate epimerase [Tetrasphaera japonica]CCH80059.1 conserved hypothetical protein [Tetrasphaera japonica T1-X7]